MKRLTLVAIAFMALCSAAFAQQTHNASTPKDPATIPLSAEEKGTVIDDVSLQTLFFQHMT